MQSEFLSAPAVSNSVNLTYCMPLGRTTYGSIQYVKKRANSISALFSGPQLLSLCLFKTHCDTDTYRRSQREREREMWEDYACHSLPELCNNLCHLFFHLPHNPTHKHAPWDFCNIKLLLGSFRYMYFRYRNALAQCYATLYSLPNLDITVGNINVLSLYFSSVLNLLFHCLSTGFTLRLFNGLFIAIQLHN